MAGPRTVGDDCQRCRADVNQLREDMRRSLDDRFDGSDRHWDAKFEEFEKRWALQIKTDERALNLAAKTVENHFGLVNNFQNRIEKMERSFLTWRDLWTLVAGFIVIMTFVVYLLRGH